MPPADTSPFPLMSLQIDWNVNIVAGTRVVGEILHVLPQAAPVIYDLEWPRDELYHSRCS